MSQTRQAQKPEAAPRRHRKLYAINFRVERELVERLRMAADASEISPSDKARRILDAALPKTL